MTPSTRGLSNANFSTLSSCNSRAHKPREGLFRRRRSSANSKHAYNKKFWRLSRRSWIEIVQAAQRIS